METWYWGVFCGDKFIGTKIGKFWTVGGAKEHKLRLKIDFLRTLTVIQVETRWFSEVINPLKV